MAENKDKIGIHVYMISIVYQCHKQGNFLYHNLLPIDNKHKPTLKQLKMLSIALY